MVPILQSGVKITRSRVLAFAIGGDESLGDLKPIVGVEDGQIFHSRPADLFCSLDKVLGGSRGPECAIRHLDRAGIAVFVCWIRTVVGFDLLERVGNTPIHEV